MPVRLQIISRKTGRTYKNFSGLVTETSENVRMNIRNVVSRNLTEFIQLLSDIWVDVVQRTTWVVDRPADKATIIAEPDLQMSSFRFGWHSYPGGNASMRFAMRRAIFIRQVNEMVSNYNFMTPNEKIAREISAAYRQAMMIARTSNPGDYKRDIEKFGKIGRKGSSGWGF